MRILITGGAGFIGHHYAHHRIAMGDDVTVLDNLSRVGSMNRMLGLNGARCLSGNILSPPFDPGERFDVVFHLAAQTAVTRSLDDPKTDFMVNALGTLVMLNWFREQGPPFPKFVYASTNKVYGPNPNIGSDGNFVPFPVDELCPIDLTTPYGLSKGTADLYCQDFARQYGIPTVILRQSCIYGPGQTAESDQGWLAHFADCVLNDKAITIYGDGHQVRDVLHISDLIDLYDRVLEIDLARGTVFNVGGGSEFAVSIIGGVKMLGGIAGKTPTVRVGPERHDDQRYYVSNIDKARKAFLGWKPTIAPKEGLADLVRSMSGEAQI